MDIYCIKMPDVGEGIAEAELVEWAVKVGDFVREDDLIAAVMTDKATVEIPSSANGKVVWLGGDVGELLAIGADLIHIEIEGEGNFDPDGLPAARKPQAAAKEAAPAVANTQNAQPTEPKKSAVGAQSARAKPRRSGEDVLAAPTVRRRALEAGVDLRRLVGSGPAGRIVLEDIDAYLEAEDHGPSVPSGLGRRTAITDIKIVGLRRKIAERMSLANTNIPHITIIEEIDVSALEDLRSRLNANHASARGKLTILPFLMRAIVRVVTEQPQLNAVFDDEAGVVHQHAGVHIGIATQTSNGLMVPVVRHAEALDIWNAAAELTRVSEAARTGSATRDELTGSTISITSLGALGALATTPIINHPEVAIVGVNRMAERPVWSGNQFVPRKMMNISCSFDHRVIDGWDAAVFVQRIKSLIETPAMIFVEV